MNSEKFTNVTVCDESIKNSKIDLYGVENKINNLKDKTNHIKKISNFIKKYIYIILYIIFISIFFGILFQIYIFQINKNRKTKKTKLNSKKTILNPANKTNDLIMKKIYEFASNNKLNDMEIILYSIFHDVKKGFYIDVGANDPNQVSMTKQFYKNGWRGINIEPVPYLYKKLLKYRPNDINVGMAVGNEEGNVTIYMTPNNYMSSTIIENNKYDYSNNIKTAVVNITTMEKICNKYITNETIHFLKIDVEGSEKNVILGYNFEKYRPQVIAIESVHWVRGKVTNVHEDWEYILLQKNFSFVYKTFWDRYYVDNRIPLLKERFKKVDYYLKIYFEK